MFGIVERGGRVVAMHMPEGRYGYALKTALRESVEPGSIVYTDDYKGYDGIERAYTRRTINHTARIYAEGSTHTQTIEGFFSLFKNGVRGVYHSISVKWLQGYLNEYTWRYNRRDNGRAMFLDLIAASASRTR